MKAVIIADRSHPELAPLTEKTCAGLLPVAGKPLIEHTLESLVEIGVQQAYVVTSEFGSLPEGIQGSSAVPG